MADLVVAHIEEHRDEYGEAASGEVEAVVNINVPDCVAGEPKELVTVDLATVIPEGINVFQTDCTVEVGEPPTDDVLAMAAGHSALSLVPPEAPPG